MDIIEVYFWLVIRKSDSAVVGTSTVEIPDGAWDLTLFDIKPWFFSNEPSLNNPDEGSISFDPTLNNPAYDVLLAEYNDTKTSQGGAKQWLVDNPNAKLLFTLSIAELEAEINGLDLTDLPTPTANRLKLMLKTLSIAVRVFARREGLL
ncbi:MAG: hypothetical protein GY743_23400 [Planctomycetaceae bacterium]|nr:hypothetical protein [Planctomycetaceae bacterium]